MGRWIVCGLARMAVRVTVGPGGAEGLGAGVEGEDGDEPPQAPRARARTTTPGTTGAGRCDRAREDTRPPGILDGRLKSTRDTGGVEPAPGRAGRGERPRSGRRWGRGRSGLPH